MDKLNSKIHRFLISTTSRFTGCYEGEFLRIDHAWQGANSGAGLRESIQENPRSRNYFVLSAEIEPPEAKSILVPNYAPLSEQACAALSVLFGKRFDTHGPLVSHRQFYVPDFAPLTPTTYYEAAPYSHRPRQDLCIPLKLELFELIAPLFTDQSLDEKVRRIFFAAARFYLRSLQMFDVEPEFAYLDLITCGEILANFFEYTADKVYDDEAKAIFARIRAEMAGGEAMVRKLQGRMRQIKRVYVLTLTGLLKDSFFDMSECSEQYGRLRKEDIEKRLKGAYDLRSQYVHTGIDFGRWTRPIGGVLNEVQLGPPVIESKELKKAITQAPTFFGLERIMRYCLARFLHLNGVPIDASLDGPAPLGGPDVFSIDLAATELFQMTQKRAYELWEKRGRPLWDDHADWYAAEGEIASDSEIIGRARH